MSDEGASLKYGLDSPTHCIIEVQGHISESWAEHFHMEITHQMTLDNVSISLLRGDLIDHAELMGVLNGLYGFGFALISVKCTPCLATKNQDCTDF